MFVVSLFNVTLALLLVWCCVGTSVGIGVGFVGGVVAIVLVCGRGGFLVGGGGVGGEVCCGAGGAVVGVGDLCLRQ